MFTTFFFLPLFLALIHVVLAQSNNLTIVDPSFTQCQPTLISWADTGNPPYDLLIVSAQDMCGEALEDLGNFTCNAVDWTVNLPAGTEAVLSLVDAAGNEAWSGTITVGNSSDTSCLNSTVTSALGSDSSSGPILTVPPSGGDATSPAASPLASSSAFAPAGAANAGLGSASGALSMRPTGAFALFSCAVLAVVAFTF